MKKITFLLSGLLTLICICTLITTKIIEIVLPKLGYIAYQSAAAGGYSESLYIVDFTVINTFSIFLIILSISLCVYLYIKEAKK